MSLIADLRGDILKADLPLSAVMRKAAVLAHRLQNEPMRVWVRKEQDGYSPQDADLPPYRVSRTNSYGDILTRSQEGTGVSIPAIYLPEMVREEMERLKVTFGIRSLEAHLDSDQQAIRLPWPSDLLLLVSAERYDGGLYAAYRWLPRDMIAQVLDTVRNKLLDFTLELEERYPQIEASDEALRGVSVETSQQVFYVTFYGPNGRFNLGSSDHSTNVASGV